MDKSQTIEEVRVERQGRLGRITLNRPKALNALTLAMVEAIDAALDGFEADPEIGLVLLEGEGPRGFCAGGDIRVFYESGRKDGVAALAFWRAEYALDARIANFPKPIVAFMRGIVMGGGVGLAAHASHRVVTEDTMLAMPEVRIGYFPDVGISRMLARAPGHVGIYMALTAARIGAGDAIHAGFADSFVPAEKLAALAGMLAGTDRPVAEIIASFAEPVAPALAPHFPAIERCFARPRVEAIQAMLRAEETDFAVKALDDMCHASPLSLKVTLDVLKRARDASLDEVLEMDLVVDWHMLANPDFYEGIRAAVIEKGHVPQWRFASVDDVPDEAVAAFFVPNGPSIRAF